MSVLSVSAVVSFAILGGVDGHGSVTNPSPRYLASAQYCPWCVGEHRPGSNPYGTVNRDERLSHPCGGTNRGDQTYPSSSWGPYVGIAGTFDRPTYTAGGSFDATVVLNADHGGDAQWHLCPHSESETEDCFRANPISEWKDVHCFRDCNNQVPHAFDDQHYTESIKIPDATPGGTVTLRWYWVCKWTDEVFTSCIDAEIQGAASPPSTEAPSTSAAAPAPAETTQSGGQTGGGETEPTAPSTAAPCASQDAVGADGQGRRALRVEINDPGCGDLVSSAHMTGAAWAAFLTLLLAMR